MAGTARAAPLCGPGTVARSEALSFAASKTNHHTGSNNPVSDLAVILAMSRKYADVPMDFADASLVVLAMRTGTDVIVSLDQDFDIYKLAHKKSFKNLLAASR